MAYGNGKRSAKSTQGGRMPKRGSKRSGSCR